MVFTTGSSAPCFQGGGANLRMLKRLLHAPTRVHGRSSFGAFVDKNCSVMLNGQKCLVLPFITYDELLGPVRG